jgi:hypothetical protein
MLASGVVLHYENARLQTAARSRALLDHFNWKLFDNSPYSPELVSSDYHLFTYPMNCLRPYSFNNNEELMKMSKRG